MGLFGGIMRALFGGSKSKSESGNKFADQTSQQFAPWIAAGGQGLGRTAAILGGGPEGEQALQDWWKSSGGKFQLDQGLGDVNDRFHSIGLGRSGAAMKAMEGYRSDLASTKLGEFLGLNNELARLGLGAGGIVSGAGQYSKGGGSSTNGGLATIIGALLASDPRLKTNVEKVGEYPDGLGVYDFDYLPIEGRIAEFMPEGRQRGVMADEVARLRPWALGPEVEGFQTVNYGAL